ncbi:arabinosyltransferase domain-containing protein [Blastococcus sp. SYSU DS0617]
MTGPRPAEPADDVTAGATAAPAGTASSSGWTRPRRRAAWLLAVLAVALAVALPLAPVSVDTPEVQWPLDPADPQPTTALFMPYRPIDVTVTAPCATVRALAAGQQDGDDAAVLVATALPSSTRGNERSLSIGVDGDTVRIVSSGALLWEGPVPAQDDCELVVRADQEGTRASLEAPGREAQVLADDPGAKVPEITAFTTDVTAGTGPSPTVVAHPDARFQTSPTAAKLVLIALHVLAVLACLWLLWRAGPPAGRRRDRTDGAAGPGPARADLAYERVPWGRAMGLLADVGVVVTLVAWTVIGFLNTDDYYYSLEARTLDNAGFVGNQFRFFNVPEVPFVLLQTLLAPLTELSTQPVVLRLPSLAAGLLVWWLLTRQLLPLLVERPHPALRLVAGVALLAWWLPWNIGVRPEFLVTLAWTLTVTLALQAIRLQRAWLIGLAAAIAGTAVTVTASGLACVATLLILLPRLWPTLRRSALGAWASLALVVACASVPATVVFSDATLATAVTALRVHQEVGPAESWDMEIMRYWYLTLGPDENMRTFAKQLVVILTVVVVIAVSISLLRMTRARGGRVSWLVPALGFLITVVALVPSPTKWTHHFGALAAPGALALTVAVALLVRRRPDRWASAGILGAVAFTAALAFHAGNQQVESSAYGVTPVLPNALGNPFLWLAAGLLVAAAAWWVRRRAGSTHQPWPEAAVGTLVAALVMSVLIQTASAGLATWRYRDSFALAASAVDVLTGEDDCGFADHAVALTDPAVLRAAPGADDGREGATDDAFPGVGSAVGALAPDDVRRWSTWTEEPPVGATTITTPWLEIGDLTERDVLAVSVTGNLDSGTEVTVQYGTEGAGEEPTVLQEVPVEFREEDEPDGSWEQERLGSTTHLPAGATLVRVEAIDRNFTGSGWLGVTDPYRVDGRILRELFEGDDVVLDWPVGFTLPCVEPPRIADGLVPPVEWIMLSEKYADAPELLVIDERGGSYSTLREVADTTTYPGFSPGVGPEYTEWGRLVRYDRELPADAYRLVEDERVIPGWGWWPGAGDGPVPEGDQPD